MVLEFSAVSDIPGIAKQIRAIYQNQYRKADRKIRTKNGRLRYPSV